MRKVHERTLGPPDAAPTSVRRAVAVCVVCMIVCGSASCSVDQHADVSAYRQLSDPPSPLPMQRADDSLSLLQALRLTAAHHEQLGVQGERYVQALADRQRLAAALSPTIDLFSSVALRENTGENGIVQSDIGVRGQYRLLTGLNDLRNVRAADARVDSAKWLILDLRETLLVQTARAYYEALRSQRLATVLRSSVETQSDRLADAKARNEVGFTRPLDVAQIEAQVSRTRSQLIAATRQEGEARSLLVLLTNADVAAAPLTDEYETTDVVPSLSDLCQLVRIHRQDILAARADADAARALVDAAIGQYAPSLTLNIDYFLLRGPDDSPANLSSLLEVNVPIFTANRIEAQVRGAWAQFRERVLTYRLREREARRDVETAFVRVQAATNLVAELQSQVQIASQAVELAEVTYQAGLGTNLERVIAQDQLLAAELEAVNAAFATKIAHLELRRACGLVSHDVIGTALPQIHYERNVDLESPVLDRSSHDESVVTPRGGDV